MTTVKKKSDNAVAATVLDILNVPILRSLETVKEKLKKIDTTKTVYIIAFVGAIAFIAQGLS